LCSPAYIYNNCFPIILCAVISAPSDAKKHEQKDENLPVDIKLPVKHVLSRELQVFKIIMSLQAILCITVLSNISHGGTMSDIGRGFLAFRHGQFYEGWWCHSATYRSVWWIFGSPPWSAIDNTGVSSFSSFMLA
jgi:hypothetical protein